MCWLGNPSEGSGFSRHRAATEAVSPPIWHGCCARQNVFRDPPQLAETSLLHDPQAVDGETTGSLARSLPCDVRCSKTSGSNTTAPHVSHASADNRSPPGGRGVERIAPPETEQWGDSLQSTRPEWGESPHSAETPILPFKLFLFAELRNCRGNDDFSGGCQHGKPLGNALAQNVHFILLGTAVRTAAGAACVRSHGGVCAGCLGSDP